MLLTVNSTTFCFYAITVILMCLNLLFLWMYSAVMRNKEKISPNPEDRTFTGSEISSETPPATARVLRAHGNAQAAIYPFLFLGLIYTFSGGGPAMAAITFAIFCITRWLHSFCYLAAKQPFRTITFLAGVFTTLALVIEVIVTMVHH